MFMLISQGSFRFMYKVGKGDVLFIYCADKPRQSSGGSIIAIELLSAPTSMQATEGMMCD
jgi:hypothetical protein